VLFVVQKKINHEVAEITQSKEKLRETSCSLWFKKKINHEVAEVTQSKKLSVLGSKNLDKNS
jgi:hypothetical protein